MKNCENPPTADDEDADTSEAGVVVTAADAGVPLAGGGTGSPITCAGFNSAGVLVIPIGSLSFLAFSIFDIILFLICHGNHALGLYSIWFANASASKVEKKKKNHFAKKKLEK